MTEKALGIAAGIVVVLVAIVTFVIVSSAAQSVTDIQAPAANSSSVIPSSIPSPVPALAPVVVVTDQPQPSPMISDPWAVVAAYYADVESHDYPEAWSLLSASFRGSADGGDAGNYQAWMDGYADTGAQYLTDEGESGDTVSIKLSAYDTAAGVWQYFTGSYTVADGLIVSGDIVQV